MITKQKALEDTMELWNYIAEATDLLKNINNFFIDFKVITKEDEQFLRCEVIRKIEKLKNSVAKALGFNYENDEPSCEYEINFNTEDICDHCPIWSSGNNHCTYNEYGEFLYNPTRENALAIAYLAEEKLDELETTEC